MVSDIKPGGTFLLNTIWDMEGLEKHLPGQVKRYLAQNNINFYTINGVKLGEETGMGTRINHYSSVRILQACRHHSFSTTLLSI